MPKSDRKRYRSILIICDMNRCRSPMAEAILKKMISDKIKVRSAGISANARNRGFMSLDAKLALGEDKFYDDFFENFRTTALIWHRDLIKQSDLILTMTNEQKDKVLGFKEVDGKEVYTLKDFARDNDDHKSSIFDCDISDPFGGGDEEYLRCKEEIEDCLKKVVEKIT
jgi:protein-tyrosine phosphatase